MTNYPNGMSREAHEALVATDPEYAEFVARQASIGITFGDEPEALPPDVAERLADAEKQYRLAQTPEPGAVGVGRVGTPLPMTIEQRWAADIGADFTRRNPRLGGR